MRWAAGARAVAFLFVFWTSSFLFPVSRHQGDVVAFRPPSAVFGLAWVLLSAAAARSWALEAASLDFRGARLLFIDSSFVLLLGLLALYPALSKKRVVSLWVVAGAFAASLAILATESAWGSRALMAPVVAWLVFALLMQTFVVQNAAVCAKESPSTTASP